MSDKPKITATIKFRGVTIEDMTVEELRQLRDVINQLVGEPQRVVERHDHYYPRPWYEPNRIWYSTGSWSVANSSTLQIDASNVSSGFGLNTDVTNAIAVDGEHAHYTVALN